MFGDLFLPYPYSDGVKGKYLLAISLLFVSVLVIKLFVESVLLWKRHQTKLQVIWGMIYQVLAVGVILLYVTLLKGSFAFTFTTLTEDGTFYLAWWLWFSIYLLLYAFRPVLRYGTFQKMMPYSIPYCVLAGIDLLWMTFSMFVLWFQYQNNYIDYGSSKGLGCFLPGKYNTYHCHVFLLILNLIALYVIHTVNRYLCWRKEESSKQNTVRE